MVLCFTNAPPAIAPYGSKKALFGTNPICFGTPTGKKIPFILDTSTSLINRGKIRRAEKLGHKIPFGVALDKYGNPTRNPKKALKKTKKTTDVPIRILWAVISFMATVSVALSLTGSSLLHARLPIVHLQRHPLVTVLP